MYVFNTLITIKGISGQVAIFTGKYVGREYLRGAFIIALVTTKRITRVVLSYIPAGKELKNI